MTTTATRLLGAHRPRTEAEAFFAQDQRQVSLAGVFLAFVAAVNVASVVSALVAQG